MFGLGHSQTTSIAIEGRVVDAMSAFSQADNHYYYHQTKFTSGNSKNNITKQTKKKSWKCFLNEIVGTLFDTIQQQCHAIITLKNVISQKPLHIDRLQIRNITFNRGILGKWWRQWAIGDWWWCFGLLQNGEKEWEKTLLQM